MINFDPTDAVIINSNQETNAYLFFFWLLLDALRTIDVASGLSLVSSGGGQAGRARKKKKKKKRHFYVPE